MLTDFARALFPFGARFDFREGAQRIEGFGRSRAHVLWRKARGYARRTGRFAMGIRGEKEWGAENGSEEIKMPSHGRTILDRCANWRVRIAALIRQIT